MYSTIVRVGVLGFIVAIAGCSSSGNGSSSAAGPDNTMPVSAGVSGSDRFSSPTAAMNALADAISHGDCAASEGVLGMNCRDVVSSEDVDADREDSRRTAAMIREQLRFEEIEGGRQVALIGKDGWRFPVPLVATMGGWRFDVDAGRDELQNRRIGRNELLVVEVLRECIEAQEDYRRDGADGKVVAYAQRFASHEGQHDGLYWATSGDEPRSPLGPFIARAACDEVRPVGQAEIIPFHGYYFRVLCQQGPAAPGGEKSYLDADGHMTQGCAVVAWPASYGRSGVMTFMAKDGGIVLEKNLGELAAPATCPMERFDPDDTWSVVKL